MIYIFLYTHTLIFIKEFSQKKNDKKEFFLVHVVLFVAFPGCGRISPSSNAPGDSQITKIANTKNENSSPLQLITGDNIIDTNNFPLSESLASNIQNLTDNVETRKNIQDMLDFWKLAQQNFKPVCLECGRTCSNHGNLKQHIKNMHGPPDQWEMCHVCQKKCKSRQYLLQHLLQTHGIRQRSRFMRNF